MAVNVPRKCVAEYSLDNMERGREMSINCESCVKVYPTFLADYDALSCANSPHRLQHRT